MILLVGDLHFGVKNNSTKFLESQSRWFREELIKTVKQHNVETVFILGDVFESRNALSPVILTEVRQLFKELTEITKVLCLLGNHDIFFRNRKDIHWMGILEDQGVKIFDKPTEINLHGLKTLVLPWIIKDEHDDVLKLLTENHYDLCLGHLEINSFEVVKGITEEHGLSKELFANCSKVFSGHYHIRQDEIYIGTPYELCWNDYLNDKGIVLLNPKTNKETFIPTINTPKHIKINYEETAFEDLKAEQIKNNIIKICFKKGVEEADKLNYIEKVNSMLPMTAIVEDDMDADFGSDKTVETSIKDTLGFLNEYIGIIELPEEIDKKELFNRLQELHSKSC